MKRILVVTPHCDDAELGCAGYLAREAKRGAEIKYVLGTASSIDHMHRSDQVSADTRLGEMENAMKVLGASSYEVLVHDLDGEMHMASKAQMVRKLDLMQNDFQPHEVFIPLPSAHQDHRTMWEVGVAATRPSPAKHNPALIAAYEYPLTGWGEGADASSFRGGMYVDITDYMDKKEEALDCYKTQMRGKDHQLSVGGAKALARLRGMEAGGCEYAELFHILRLRSD